MTTLKNKLMVVFALLVLTASAAVASTGATAQQRMMDKIRKELVTLPYYGVFDNLAYDVQGNTVILFGQVVRPSTRQDAERRVARIEGVDRVINNIEVFPVSPFDDSIRVRTHRVISRTGSLYRYFMGANPSIHIIVRNDHVTLEGVVSNQMDSQLAYMAARSVPGVFSVTSNLRVERNS